MLYYPKKPPSLSTFLIFLSNCPLLGELEYHIDDEGSTIPTTVITTSTSASVDRLNFPNLERLILKSKGPSGYDYIQGILARIGALECLSQFQLVYQDCIFPSSNVFESVPSGIFSHFSGHSYLSMSTHTSGCGNFDVISALNRDFSFEFSQNPPLRISGETRSSLLNEGSVVSLSSKFKDEKPQ